MNGAWDVGLYSRVEAARYSGVPSTTVHRWLARPLAAGKDLVSFDEFVTMLFVRQLRTYGVRLRDIRAAERDLRERTSHEHPFVYEALWVAGGDVLVRVAP